MKNRRDELGTQLMFDALVMPINMSQVNSRALGHLPSASVAERQQAVIDVVSALVEGGLAVTGYPGKGDGELVVESLADTLREIRDTYIARYDEPAEWIWSCWLKLTPKGVELAISTPEGCQIAEHERERLDSIRAERARDIGADSS